MQIPLSRSDYFRAVAKEARIRMRNRYFESNPILTKDIPVSRSEYMRGVQQSALIARMGMNRYLFVDNGPIRGVYSQPGSFSDATFVASADNLWRIDTNNTATLVGAIGSPSLLTHVSMAATSNIGTTPANLFVTGGAGLMLYMETGYALGTVSGTPANNDVIRIDSTYYKFTSGSVTTGTPAGTLANPWLVALGANAAAAWANFAAAVANNGTVGTQYSTGLVANASVTVVNIATTLVKVRANAVGTAGNTIVTTTTGAALAWTGGTLSGGGNPTWTQIDTPGAVGIISLGYIASYVVAVPAQGQGINGRFFWINPGETTINALDFATAERSPDPVSDVIVFGDQFWLPGSSTTEVWYFTGNILTPVLRTQGIVFDRGAWPGTAVQVKDSMIIVDNEGAVWQIQGGTKRISRPDIEERIREAIQFQASTGN